MIFPNILVKQSQFLCLSPYQSKIDKSLNLYKRFINFRYFHSSNYNNISNLWINRHKLEESQLSELPLHMSNGLYTPESLHILSVANKIDLDKAEFYESKTLDMLENTPNISPSDLSHSLYFLSERGVNISDNLYNKFININNSRVTIALELNKLTSNNITYISEKLYNNEIELNITDLAYLNLISVLSIENINNIKLDINCSSFLKHVVLTHYFHIHPPSDERITRERQEAKEKGIVSESLQIGIFYYTLVNAKLKEIYIKRQPNDYLDKDCQKIRPFILWKEEYAKSNGYKLIHY